MTLAAKPIQRVLGRHNLVLGGEREPVLVSALLCGGVALASMTFAAFVICGLITVCRWMAKADPQMTKVYIRTVKIKGYYPAFSRPYRKF
ncbi:MAG TPA: conjugal transfer protein TrbD [Caulobacteraceae bacterium]|jgi:type IV secretion system protein VirB3